MQPVRLEMSGFLSYREQEVIDFSGFDIACITGENGAGKSSILDAITYALFGSSRVKSDVALINNASDQADVVFNFFYNETLFRIIRRIYRNTKPTEVIFSYFDSGKDLFVTIGANSKSKTDEEIRNRLNLDYETFTTASFFLQGQADSFARSNSSDRKDILAKIMRLNRWEEYQTIAKGLHKEKNYKLLSERTYRSQLAKKILDEATLQTKLETLNLSLKEIVIKENSAAKQARMLDSLLIEFETLRIEIQNKQDALLLKNESIEQKEDLLKHKKEQISKLGSLIARESEINLALNNLRRMELFIVDQRMLEKDVENLNEQRTEIDKRIKEKTERIESEIHQLRVKRERHDSEVQQIPKISAKLAELRKLQSDSEEDTQKLRRLNDKLDLLDEFSSRYQDWFELDNSIKSEEQQIQFRIDRLNIKKDEASQSILEMKKLSDSIEDRRKEQVELEDKKAAIEEIQTQIDRIKIELESIDTQLSKNNERLSHLNDNHSPNCPTCERALSAQDKIALETKINIEIGQQRKNLTDLIEQKELRIASIKSIERNFSESILAQLDAVKISLARFETLHLAEKRKADEWTSKLQEELNQLTSKLASDSPARMKLSQIQHQLVNAYIKIMDSKPAQGPREANEIITQEKRKVHAEKLQLSNKLGGLGDLHQQIAETQALLSTITANQAAWLNENEEKLKLWERNLTDKSFLTNEYKQKTEIEDRSAALNFQPNLLAESKVFVEANKSRIETESAELQIARPRLLDLEKDIQEIGKDLQSLIQEGSEFQRQIHKMETKLLKEEEVKAEKLMNDQLFLNLQNQKDHLNQTIGEIKQRLVDIDDAKEKIKNTEIAITKLENELSNLEFAERAFGNKGIPAMLIEQAIPDLEDEANRLLSKLTDGFSIRIHTQKEYRDSKRQDTRETLEIEISDGSGSREYETYSGGEAFRVNFAIRLALSKLLAHRADAKLETLVIDEGFGSQDDDGKQKLVEAIRAIQPEFKKILVITHLEELKEKFDHRIEVMKVGHTSKIRVI